MMLDCGPHTAMVLKSHEGLSSESLQHQSEVSAIPRRRWDSGYSQFVPIIYLNQPKPTIL